MPKGLTAERQRERDRRIFKCEKIILQRSKENATGEYLNAKELYCKKKQKEYNRKMFECLNAKELYYERAEKMQKKNV